MILSNADRELLNAAIELKHAYDTQKLSPTPITPLPAHHWERLQRLERQIKISAERDYAAANQRTSQLYLEQLRILLLELNSIEAQLGQRPKITPKPSLRFLYEELQSLADEFIEVDIDRALKEVVVFTDRVVLEGIDLGQFEIRLSITRIRESQPYRVMAIESNTASSDDNVPHPHIQGENLCVGDGLPSINNALATGRLCDFFLTVRQILQTYNASSAYVALEDWNGVTCGDCGEMVDSGDSYCCENCHSRTCDYCTRSCNECDVSLCCECSDVCKDCDHGFCRSCLEVCEQCEQSTCHQCLENELCESCHNLQQEQDDAEQKDSPHDAPTPQETATETSREIETSQAAVQPVRVGEAVISA
ncbi:hypothetical protein [Thalassoglobus sp.]|uniref:hypothetical protein n=1 Tax=Thalassoglobus sp. TaxID=2795869 RepID=UPI003AA8D1DE